MKNVYSIIIAMMILVVFGGVSPVEAAAKEKVASLEQKACKDKKPGDTVKVDGKDVKCPEANKKPHATGHNESSWNINRRVEVRP